uniref:NAD(P)-binding domain-containing protein n=1 Tax=Chromera velia CCMP2878 TaxID=1169474 RepID=A0A0G4F390_9ALVE|mmetsp:Transcript_39357/g.77453  ORF Transcript_39357/g.77453 Transcript_39357/m.77453 type:complete len:365 (-) Transcript_39357:191-1285(-)|eukprot:Cvel_14946.t1-p1 / transcript=Cvel_14946.t1 / gene=Cvel_14946 / organism=Chromera_velia_CCMP2878 / gene_product=Uncharacterized sugar epimerase YhfK, putative / transcript_product=Uncharacterized sugar epimerase YhfK, putative / location=Cvel_scaffold1084:52561-54547(-) / protein_length=364 / sequence_SO=supercontig / SO=protein_coding / is_pseudo=false
MFSFSYLVAVSFLASSDSFLCVFSVARAESDRYPLSGKWRVAGGFLAPRSLPDLRAQSGLAFLPLRGDLLDRRRVTSVSASAGGEGETGTGKGPGRLLVIGASQNLGFDVVKAAAERGCKDGSFSSVVASIRPQSDASGLQELVSKFQSQPCTVAVTRCDAMDRYQCSRLLEEWAPSHIVACVGGAHWNNAMLFDAERKQEPGEKERAALVDLDANRNLIFASIGQQASVPGGIRQFLLVSAVGAGESREWIPSASKDSLVTWLDAKSRAEEYLQCSGLPYTIFRPCPMDEESGPSEVVITEGPCYSLVSRKETAEALVRCLGKENVIGKRLAVVDRKRLMQANPFVRRLECYEPEGFEPFEVV